MPVQDTVMTVERVENEEYNYKILDQNRNLIARVEGLKIGGVTVSIDGEAYMSDPKVSWKGERWNDDSNVDAISADIEEARL